MNASDVITQLGILLPQFTDKLTRDLAVTSFTRSGTEMTVDTEESHLLEPGDAVSVTGAVVPIAITSLTRVGPVGTLVTATDHDLTRLIAPTVSLSGSTESEFNGTFTTIKVVNRRTITFIMADAGPTTATGSPVIEGAESALRDYNTLYSVLETPRSHRFKITHSTSGLPDPVGTIVVRMKPRISAGISPERLVSSYTDQKLNELWLFVVLEDVVSSKDRDIRSDATANFGAGDEFRQQLIQPMTLYLFVPVTDDVSGQSGRDVAEDLFQPLCKSLLHSQFDSGLHVGQQGRVHFVSHGFFSYNSAVYVHAYSFEQVVDLVFEDTVGPDLDVAFRDITMTIFPDLDGGTGLANLTATINLDETSL